MKALKRFKKSTSAKKFTRFARSMRTMSTRTMFIAVGCVLGAAILLGAATSDVLPGKAPARTASAAPPPAAASVPVATPAADAIVAPVAAAESTANAPVQKPVTITGCLERDAENFRLKDTTGENAPKARSWKSGFLKKGSASVEVVDAANKVKLPSHVGQRVSVTGTLVDREMLVRSLQRVSASCKKS
jgi:hypothetical protein